MLRRKELLLIMLAQVAITLVIASTSPYQRPEAGAHQALGFGLLQLP